MTYLLAVIARALGRAAEHILDSIAPVRLHGPDDPWSDES